MKRRKLLNILLVTLIILCVFIFTTIILSFILKEDINYVLLLYLGLIIASIEATHGFIFLVFILPFAIMAMRSSSKKKSNDWYTMRNYHQEQNEYYVDKWKIIFYIVLAITILIWIGAIIDLETFLLPAVIATIVLFSIGFIFSIGNNCPKCNKRYPTLISSEYTGSEKIQIQKTVEDKVYNTTSGGVRNGAPKEIITRTIIVPGIRKYYHNTYSCKKCGYVFYKESYEDSEI